MKTVHKIVIGAGVLGATVGLVALSRRSSTNSTPSAGLSSIPIKGPTTALTARIPDAFFDTLAQAVAKWRAKGATLNGDDMLGAFNAESGVQTTTRNKYGYGGLNGMGADALKAVGFDGTLDDYLKLDIVQQLAYTITFYEKNVQQFAGGDYSVLSNTGRVYLINIFPAFIKKPDAFVIAQKPSGGCNASSNDWYCANAGIDLAHKGWIEVADMAPFVTKLASDPRRGTPSRPNPAYFSELRWRMREAENRLHGAFS